jgi:hypothetical protein
MTVRIKLKRRFLGDPDASSANDTNRCCDPDAPLTDRAWLMVKHYASMEEPCIVSAYKLAGFEGRGDSARTSANSLFHSPNFQKALREELELRDKLFRVDAAAVLRNLQLMANANMKDFGTWDNESFVLKSSAELTRDKAYAIEEIRQQSNGTVTIKLASRMRANELLATHLGLMVPDPSKTKDVRQVAKEIKDAVDSLMGSVPTEPPATASEEELAVDAPPGA